MQHNPDIQQFNTVEANPPAALVDRVSGSTRNQDTTRYWKTLTVPGHTTERMIAVKTSPAPARSPEVEALIDSTARKYNALYERRFGDRKALETVQKVPEVQPKKVIIPQNHVYRYGYSGIDRATLEVFGDLNLNLGSMTSEDRKKVYEHPLMQGDEKKLPLSAAVALLKVKLLDYRADLIDKKGMRPLEYEAIPQPRKAVEPVKAPVLSQSNTPTQKSLPRPVNSWAAKAEEPKKSFWQKIKDKATGFFRGSRA